MRILSVMVLLVFNCGHLISAAELPKVRDEKIQPVRVNLGRLIQAMEFIGQPFP